MKNSKGCGRKQPGRNLKQSWHSPGGTEEHHDKSVRLIAVPDEIGAGCLLNKSQKRSVCVEKHNTGRCISTIRHDGGDINNNRN
jgi:hypothetical protein